jgi:hypothetical protein
MPKTKETQIEKKENKNKKKRVTKKVTDGDLENFFNEENKKIPVIKNSEEVKHELYHLVQELREMEIRISEHYEISAFEARFPNSEKRRKKIFDKRSHIREEISRKLRFLIENGLNETEIPEELPFLPKRGIKDLILNLP